MTIADLRITVENMFGIPVTQVRLSFLEELDMQDTKRLFDYDIVQNSTVSVHLWPAFEQVYKLVMARDTVGLMFELQNSLADERAWAALFVAAFYGHTGLSCASPPPSFISFHLSHFSSSSSSLFSFWFRFFHDLLSLSHKRR